MKSFNSSLGIINTEGISDVGELWEFQFLIRYYKSNIRLSWICRIACFNSSLGIINPNFFTLPGFLLYLFQFLIRYYKFLDPRCRPKELQ